MKTKFLAAADLTIADGRFYSSGEAARPPGAKSVRTIMTGEPVGAGDVGGGAVFDGLAGEGLIVPEGSGDARVLKGIAEARCQREVGQ